MHPHHESTDLKWPCRQEAETSHERSPHYEDDRDSVQNYYDAHELTMSFEILPSFESLLSASMDGFGRTPWPDQRCEVQIPELK